jgi:D-sedoheptulose 7-phosphate isomerase
MRKDIIDRIEDAQNNLMIFKNSNCIAKIELAARICIQSIKKNGKIIFCGNGGSASDSAHLSAELVGRYLKNRKPYASLSLATSLSAITAIANDYGYENVFARQLSAIGNKNDVLFAISTSGKSKNILKAIKIANNKKIKVIFLNSVQNKKKNNAIDVDIKVPAERVDRIQELHILIGHLICEIIEKKIN